MKLGVFADPHYCNADVLCGTRRPRLSHGKIKAALEAFKQQNVDLAVCMGDLTDHCDTREEAFSCLDLLMETVRESGLPFINVPGNHDYLDFTAEELEEYGLITPPYSRVIDGIRLVVLDANYRSDMRRFDVAGVKWVDSNLPPEQVEFLKEILESSEEPCVILVHECLDGFLNEDHVINNADEIREILKNSGKVKLVIEGHYHKGADRVIDGIRYLTIPAMCEGEENRFFILNLEDEISR